MAGTIGGLAAQEVGLEAPFAKTPLVARDLWLKFPALHRAGLIELGVEFLPLAAWQAIDALVTPLLGGQLAVLGSSLGGFWATCLAARYALPAVVINPAVHPQQLLRHFIGQRQNPYTGQRYQLDESHIAELEALDPPAPDGQTRIWLLQQEGDEVLDYRLALDYYQACRITREAGGNHAFCGFERYCAQIVEFLQL